MKKGDHVKLNCYPGLNVTGIITDIKKEHGEDWKFYTVFSVTYDHPFMYRMQRGEVQMHKGQHLRCEIERYIPSEVY